jgi:hypothetical protein
MRQPKQEQVRGVVWKVNIIANLRGAVMLVSRFLVTIGPCINMLRTNLASSRINAITGQFFFDQSKRLYLLLNGLFSDHRSCVVTIRLATRDRTQAVDVIEAVRKQQWQ